jgi:hypothetical protein
MNYTVLVQLLIQFLANNNFSQHRANNDYFIAEWVCKFDDSKSVWLSQNYILWHGPDYSNFLVVDDTL